jgi:hypothetical protein
MRIIEREMIRLEPPSKEDLESTYDRLRVIHGEAYGWQPPDVQGIERLTSTRMRQFVRAWINEWDLLRLYPDYTPDIEVLDVDFGYSEDQDLGMGSEETPLEDGA